MSHYRRILRCSIKLLRATRHRDNNSRPMRKTIVIVITIIVNSSSMFPRVARGFDDVPRVTSSNKVTGDERHRIFFSHWTSSNHRRVSVESRTYRIIVQTRFFDGRLNLRSILDSNLISLLSLIVSSNVDSNFGSYSNCMRILVRSSEFKHRTWNLN